MQALEKSPVDEKHVDGCTNVHDSADGVVMYETILDSPSTYHDEKSMLEPPAATADSNHYETIPGLDEKNTSLPHTDFNQEPPSEYMTPSSQQAGVNSPSQCQKLMVRSETPAYTLLENVYHLDVTNRNRYQTSLLVWTNYSNLR